MVGPCCICGSLCPGSVSSLTTGSICRLAESCYGPNKEDGGSFLEEGWQSRRALWMAERVSAPGGGGGLLRGSQDANCPCPPPPPQGPLANS